MSLAVPGRLTSKGTRRLSHPLMCEQCDQREQTQQRRCGSPDRHLRPLTLRLEAQVPMHLLEGHLQLPAHHEPGDDLPRIGVEIGTKEGPGFEPRSEERRVGKECRL